MRPWTTRTVQAAVVAAGFAAVGTGAASATEIPELTKPDLSSVPDHIGFVAPVNACQMQERPMYGPTKAPCADTQLHASSPNLIKKVGADITTTTHGVADELRDGHPLSPDKANRVLGHVGAESARIEQLTKTRPTIGGTVLPHHLGALTQRVPNAALLDAEVGPRVPGHQGTSALDTAIDLTAVQGYETGPLINPGLVAPSLRNSPLQTTSELVPVPAPEKVLPVASKVPAVSRLDDSAGATTHHLAGTLPSGSVHRIAGQVPTSETVTDVLR